MEGPTGLTGDKGEEGEVGDVVRSQLLVYVRVCVLTLVCSI